MPETNASGWNIYYETHGERSSPPLLMILGLSHRLAHWGRLPGLLGERLFVVTWDCRGMGASERRDEPYTIADEVRDALAVMDAVELESAAVYGRSRGGMLAQELALSAPGRVTRLILSGTGHRGPGTVGYTDAVQKAMNFTPDMTREQIFEAQNIAMASPGWKERNPEAFARLMAIDLEAPPRRFAVQHQQGVLKDWTSHDRLGQISQPTLILCGADDGMQPPENSRMLAAGIPDARLELIPQAGHLPMLEQPEAVAKLVLDFVG
jgi:pimeloyl-ACP methyl ester carboxylesterase